MIVGIEAKFDAAHYLLHYLGKCNRTHGHTWTIRVEVCGKIDGESGMVVDFAELKKDLHGVIEPLDHNLLNITIDNPTCENICKYIYGKLIAKYNVQSVVVKEGDGGWARVEEKT